MMAKRSAAWKKPQSKTASDICDMPQLKRRLGCAQEFDRGAELGAVGVADPP